MYRKQSLKVIFKGVHFASTTLTCYLIYVQIELYFSKPTYSVKNIGEIHHHHVPDVFICSLPSTDLNGLKKHGYGNSFNYVRGRIQNTKLAGWVGNSSISVENVTYDISIFRSVQDCPLLVALFEHSKFGKRRIRLNFNITKFTHPQGRCCHAIIPVNAEKYHLMELYTEKNVSKNVTSAINGFQLYLIGKKVSHIHKLNNFHTNGLPFIVSEKDS